MDKVMDITEDVNRLNESDKKTLLEKFENLGFSDNPGISISSSEISKINGQKESLNVTIANVLSQYNEKLGTKFQVKDYAESLADVVTINSNEREIRKLIDGQIITNISEILTTKAILVISKVISDQLDRIAGLTETSGLNAEIVSMVGEMFSWVEKLDEIKKKFQRFDSDSKIRSLLKGNDNINNLVRTPEQEKVLDSLKRILLVR